MSTATTQADRAHAVVGLALAGDRTGLDALLATLDAPELRRLLRATVTALADALVGTCERRGVPRQQAVEWFRETAPTYRAAIEQRGSRIEQEG